MSETLQDEAAKLVAWLHDEQAAMMGAAGADYSEEPLVIYGRCENVLRDMSAALDALEAERDRLRALTGLPGDLHWHADDPEGPLECWSTPIEERWEAAGTIFEIMCAQSLPHIWVAERVLTVDDHGDPDETEAAWFASKAEAKACYPTSLAAALKGDTP